MRRMIATYARDRVGATAIEYALIAAFIAIAIVASVTDVGTGLAGIFGNVKNGF